MQIPSIPPPIVSNALPQDVVSKAVPNIQAMAPLVQNAVAPTPKAEKFNRTRDDNDRSKGRRGDHRDDAEEADKEGGHAVNIEV